MQRALEDFIRALRAAKVRVSVAEAMEASEVAASFGYGDRTLLRDALAVTLAKSIEEKTLFAETFDLYFSRQFAGEAERESQPAHDAGTGNALADMLLNDDRAGLAAAMEMAAREVNVNDVRYFTQVNYLAQRMLERMGLRELDAFVATTTRGQASGGGGLAEALEGRRSALQVMARDYVSRQFQVFGRNASGELREEILERTPLANVDQRDFARMSGLIRRLAKKLAARHVRRHKRARRGQLDIRRTLRANMAHDGVPFATIWKQKRTERPKMVAVCDVSRSVASSARFLLMFLYGLNEVVANLRSFAFSSHLVEVEDILDSHGVGDAIDKVLDKIGYLPTDYGRALDDLKVGFGDIFDRHTTVIILGDGRSNNLDPRADIVQWIAQRCRRVVWLNPEPEAFWGIGDSEMLRYRPYLHVAKTCRTIKDLERIVDGILRVGTAA